MRRVEPAVLPLASRFALLAVGLTALALANSGNNHRRDSRYYNRGYSGYGHGYGNSGCGYQPRYQPRYRGHCY